MSPTPAFSVVIKVGLTETLTFVSGFVYGPVIGFITGFFIIVLSDMASPYGPGSWTPFIASIIGLLGICAGLIHRIHARPTVLMMTVSAVAVTLLSEFLQNAWVSVFYNVPIVASMTAGAPSLVAALANNAILFPTVGIKTIRFVQEHHLNQSAEIESGKARALSREPLRAN